MRRPGSISQGRTVIVSCLAAVLLTAAPATAQSEPEPAAGPGSLASLGADRESFVDGFDVPGAWGVVDDKDSRIAYEDGALVVTLKKDASARTTTRRPAQASPAMRLEVDVQLGADGSSAGPMCGTVAGGSDFAFGAVNSADTWFLGRMVDKAVSVLASGQLEGIDVAVGTPITVAVECAMTDGGERVALWVDGQLVADVSGDDPRGPYDRVGVYADATTAGSVVRFDDAVASDGGPVPGLTTLGADTEAFVDDFAVPGAWGTVADESSVITFDDGALAITLKEDGSGRWTTHPAPYASDVLRLELDVELGADGSSADGSSAGPMCLTTDATPDVAFGVVNGAQEWAVGRIIDGSARVIARGQLEGTLITPGMPARVALECALTDEGDRMALWVDGQLVADVTSTQQHAPYGTVGVYADAVSGGSVVRFDDAVVLSGDAISMLSTLGADIAVLEDSFDDTSRWSTGKAEQGRITYGKGSLRIALRLPDSSLWTWQSLTQPVPVVRVEGTLKPGDGNGDAGFLCGAPGEGSPFYYGGLGSKGEVVVGIAVDSAMTELVRVPLPSGVEPSGRHQLAVECAVTGPSADRVAVWVDDILVLDHRTTGSLTSFDRAAAYAESDSRRFEAAFDDVTLSAGLTYAPVGDAPSVATE